MGAENHVPVRHVAPVGDDLGYLPAGYRGPVDGGSPQGRARRRPARVPLEDSYRSQLLVWREGPRRRVVAPSEEGGEPPGHPWGGPVLVLSAWNPLGEARTQQQNAHDQARLVGRVGHLGGVVRGRVVAVPPDHGWVEEALVVAGLGQGQGLELARQSGQAALVAWDEEHVEVVPTAASGSVAPWRTRWRLGEVPMTCPMRLDAQPGARCRVHGGPWTGRAIHAAALWQAHRDLLAPLLGCDACDHGAGTVDGPGGGRGAIGISPVKVASRHGGYVW